MRECNLLITGLLFTIIALGQVRFNERFNFDYLDVGFGIKKTDMDNYLITGPAIHFDSLASKRIQTLVIDSNGVVVSHNSFFKLYDWFGPGWQGNLVACTNNSFALLGDLQDTLGGVDFLLFKFNSLGDTLFTKQIQDSYFSIGRNLSVSNDNGFILVGQWDSASITQLDIVMRKIDSLGNIQWQKSFDQTNYDDALSIINTKDNGYILVGFYRTANGFQDILVIKTDSAGNELWRRIAGDQYAQSAWDIVETQDSNYVITGSWQVYNSSPTCCDPSGYQFWITKLDKDSGNTLWQKLYDDTVTGKGFRSIIELDDGSLVCAGLKTTISQAPYFGTIFKFNSNGDSLWERNYLAPNVVNGWSILNDIIATSDGGFIAVGEAGGDTLTQDTWILKVDSEGCEVWNCLGVGLPELNPSSKGLELFPNPAWGNSVTVKINDAFHGRGTIEIYDANGRQVFKEEIERGVKEMPIDISHYADGLYYVKALSGDNIFSAKLIIMK